MSKHAMTFRTMAFSIRTLSITIKNATLDVNDNQPKVTLDVLNIVMLNVVMLRVVNLGPML